MKGKLGGNHGDKNARGTTSCEKQNPSQKPAISLRMKQELKGDNTNRRRPKGGNKRSASACGELRDPIVLFEKKFLGVAQ